MDDRQREIRLKGERQAEQTLIAVSLVFGAVCLYLALGRGDMVWLAGLIPSAALFVLAVGALTDKRPRLVISSQGVEGRAIGVGLLPWTAIAAMEETAVRQSRFLCLKLHDPAAWRAHAGMAPAGHGRPRGVRRDAVLDRCAVLQGQCRRPVHGDCPALAGRRYVTPRRQTRRSRRSWPQNGSPLTT